MEEAYRRANEAAIASGKSRGHFIVDLCKWVWVSKKVKHCSCNGASSWTRANGCGHLRRTSTLAATALNCGLLQMCV
eukprot:1161780-Pelagomonas_calceolata.AAC.2